MRTILTDTPAHRNWQAHGYRLNRSGLPKAERISLILNNWNGKYRSGHGRENGIYGIRSKMSECMCISDVFVIFAMRQHTKTNEFHIFTKNLKSIMQIKVTEEKNGTHSVRSHTSECVLLNLFLILAVRQHTPTLQAIVFAGTRGRKRWTWRRTGTWKLQALAMSFSDYCKLIRVLSRRPDQQVAPKL